MASVWDILGAGAAVINPVGLIANSPAIFAGEEAAKKLNPAQPTIAQRSINPTSIIQAQNQQTINQNDAIIKQLQGSVGNVQGAREYATAYDQFALQQQQQLAQQTQAQLAQQTALGYGNAAGANAAGQKYVSDLGQLYGGIAGSNQAAMNNYSSQIQPYKTAVAPAQFVAAQADPYGVSLQNQALGNFSGMMNGSMDIQAAQVARAAQAQAAMYYSNPKDIAAQQSALDQLQGIAFGSLDWQSQAAQAYADPALVKEQMDIYHQLRGVGNGTLDQQSEAARTFVSQETRDKQAQGIEKLWGLTDPTITAQERLMFEKARREQETSERASRDAVMSDLSARGFGGSGMEQTKMLGVQEQLGQERTLADLGAQANAIQRSTNALGMYIDATGQLRSQEFDEAFARAAAGDAMAVSNANRRLQGMGMAADQINGMRQASFQEAYQRGLAADAASAANQATRLSGAGMAADQANAIRAANDMVGMNNATNQTNVNMFNAGEKNRVAMFNVGEQNRVGIANQQTRAQGAIAYGNEANAIRSANDQINMWNAGQQNYINVSNSNLASNEAQRITNLMGQEMDRQTGINSDLARMGESYTNTALGENNLAAGRNQSAIDAGTRNALGSYGVGMDLIGGYSSMGANEYNRALGTQAVQSDIGRTSIQNNLNNNQLANQGTQLQMSDAAYKSALAQLGDDDDSVLGFARKTIGI